MNNMNSSCARKANFFSKPIDKIRNVNEIYLLNCIHKEKIVASLELLIIILY